MKQRVDGDIGVAAFPDITSGHVPGDIVDIRGHADVVSGNALGKSGGTAGIKNVGQVLYRIDGHGGLQGRVLQQRSKRINPLVTLDRAAGNLVEEHAESPFPKRQKIGQVRHDHPFQAGAGNRFLDVAEIGVHADDGFDPGIFDHVGDFMGSVDGRHRNDDGADLLDAEKGDDPLGGIGDVDHHPVALADAHGGQRTGEALAECPQTAESEPFAEIDNRRPFRITLAHPVEPGKGQFVGWIFVSGHDR